MKKVTSLALTALVALAAGRSSAAVTWFNVSTAGANGGAGSYIFIGLDGDTPLPIGSVFQIIWSADATYSSGSVFDAGDYTANGDTLLFQGASDDWSAASGASGAGFGPGMGISTDTAPVGDGSQTYVVPAGGFVYGRIFNTTGALTTPGIDFGQTAMAPVTSNATNTPAPDLQQQIEWGTINNDYTDTVASGFLTGQVSLDNSLSQGTSGYQGAGVWSTVPEPGTFAFIGIGALMLGLRRKFARS